MNTSQVIVKEKYYCSRSDQMPSIDQITEIVPYIRTYFEDTIKISTITYDNEI